MRYLALLLVLVGCSADESKVREILRAEGCEQIEVGGWDTNGRAPGEVWCDQPDLLGGDTHTALLFDVEELKDDRRAEKET